MGTSRVDVDSDELSGQDLIGADVANVPAGTAFSDALMRLGSGQWRVFLSHTQELAEFPRDNPFVAAAKAAIERAGHASWTASPRPPLDVCQDAVRRSQVFAAVIGFRYGTPVRDYPSRSYMEAEFDAAVQAGIPRLIFLVDEEPEIVVPRNSGSTTSTRIAN